MAQSAAPTKLDPIDSNSYWLRGQYEARTAAINELFRPLHFEGATPFEAYHQFLSDLIGGKPVDNVSFHRVYNPEAQPERQFEEWLRCHHRAQALAAG